jgi:hypothetical protein
VEGSLLCFSSYTTPIAVGCYEKDLNTCVPGMIGPGTVVHDLVQVVYQQKDLTLFPAGYVPGSVPTPSTTSNSWLSVPDQTWTSYETSSTSSTDYGYGNTYSFSLPEIVGIIIGLVFGIPVLVGIIAFLIWRHRRRSFGINKKLPPLPPDEPEVDENASIEKRLPTVIEETASGDVKINIGPVVSSPEQRALSNQNPLQDAEIQAYERHLEITVARDMEKIESPVTHTTDNKTEVADSGDPTTLAVTQLPPTDAVRTRGSDVSSIKSATVSAISTDGEGNVSFEQPETVVSGTTPAPMGTAVEQEQQYLENAERVTSERSEAIKDRSQRVGTGP